MSKLPILIVEDEEDIRELIHDHIQSSYPKVEKAANLAEAKKHLSETKFAAMLLDINLDYENGGELLQFLRDEETPNKDLPVIVISGILNDEFIEKNSSKVAMLPKPFDAEKLLEILGSSIKKEEEFVEDDDLSDLL